MKHFFKLGEMNVLPLLHAVQRQPELWNANDLRTRFPGTPHKEASDIWLWFNAPNSADVANDRDVVPYPAWAALPQARSLVFDLLRAVEAVQLGRVIITKLAPGKKITPHVDAGAPALFYKRYQIALQSLPGALFRIADETVNFNSGEVWLIDNRAEHAVENNSKDDRIVMIVDVRPG
ncbi:MAG TPA: aspartyl/asparaginyl beta-hydroxylase domain-containing protein [Pseudolabrys sp.]|nr:aspartyl/asparaginyl beta-hydroxylase domain-containing protein [Pseudolabrys sp.]